jgi:hypothetical protein
MIKAISTMHAALRARKRQQKAINSRLNAKSTATAHSNKCDSDRLQRSKDGDPA